MSFFKEVEGEAAVMVVSGVYRQTPLFTRDGHLYAKVGNGFVRLMHDGSTSKHRMRLEYLSWTGPLCRDKFGRLCTVERQDHLVLSDDASQNLLGPPK